jgi:hypothetical protein
MGTTADLVPSARWWTQWTSEYTLVKKKTDKATFRKPIADGVLTEVLALSRRRCCICFGLARDLELKQGQVAHLDQARTNHKLDNLAFLCLAHHDAYDSRTSQSKGFTASEVRRFRKELHEVIEQAWREPVVVAGATVRGPADVSGRYVRETDHESAELQVALLPNSRVHVTGISLWGTKREFGPNIGQLDFQSSLADGVTTFEDRIARGDCYRLEIAFRGRKAFVAEQYVVGYFGMNVSFEGEYERV